MLSAHNQIINECDWTIYCWVHLPAWCFYMEETRPSTTSNPLWPYTWVFPGMRPSEPYARDRAFQRMWAKPLFKSPAGAGQWALGCWPLSLCDCQRTPTIFTAPCPDTRVFPNMPVYTVTPIYPAPVLIQGSGPLLTAFVFLLTVELYASLWLELEQYTVSYCYNAKWTILRICIKK